MNLVKHTIDGIAFLFSQLLPKIQHVKILQKNTYATKSDSQKSKYRD